MLCCVRTLYLQAVELDTNKTEGMGGLVWRDHHVVMTNQYDHPVSLSYFRQVLQIVPWVLCA